MPRLQPDQPRPIRRSVQIRIVKHQNDAVRRGVNVYKHTSVGQLDIGCENQAVGRARTTLYPVGAFFYCSFEARQSGGMSLRLIRGSGSGSEEEQVASSSERLRLRLRLRL